MNPFSFLGKRARASRANERGRALAAVGRAQEAIARVRARVSARTRPGRCRPSISGCSTSIPVTGGARRVPGPARNRAAMPRIRAVGGTSVSPRPPSAGGTLRVRRGRALDCVCRMGTGPPDFPCGRTPIRLNPDADGEVVWSDRVDPARARIVSIPLAESGFRFADLVLHDGAAKGYRRLGDRDVPVFDCLQLLEASSFSTWVAEVEPSEAPATPDPSSSNVWKISRWNVAWRRKTGPGPLRASARHAAKDAPTLRTSVNTLVRDRTASRHCRARLGGGAQPS